MACNFKPTLRGVNKDDTSMKIGMVLAGMPTYSETFLLNKVRVLERTGHEVHLFVASSPLKGRPFRRLHTGYDVGLRGVERQLARVQALIRLLRHAHRSVKLFQLNRQDGMDTRRNLISLLNAAHIIGHRLDWIHFAFATTALSLENIGRATGARMAVSIRGFDISLFPLKNPGCYELLWKRIDRLHYISQALYRRALADGLPAALPAYLIEPAADAGLRERLPTNPARQDGGCQIPHRRSPHLEEGLCANAHGTVSPQVGRPQFHLPHHRRGGGPRRGPVHEEGTGFGIGSRTRRP